MKFNCGRKVTFQEKHEKQKAKRLKKEAPYTVWHKWFAWYPIRIADHDCRWLEFVERKYDFWGYFYYNRFERVYYRTLR